MSADVKRPERRYGLCEPILVAVSSAAAARCDSCRNAESFNGQLGCSSIFDTVFNQLAIVIAYVTRHIV